MRTTDDGWCLEVEPAQASPDPLEAERMRLSELLREAMLILDGEAPDEVPLSGEGWSLIGPVEPAPAPAEPVSPAVAVAMPDNVVALPRAALPVPEQCEQQPDVLRSAMHDALEEAIAEGWALDDDEAPSETLELSSEEQAFFDEGDALATLRVTGPAERFDPEPEPEGFWTRFWRKTG